MVRRFVIALMALLVIGLVTYTVWLKPATGAQEVAVVSRTSGREIVKAEIADGQVKLSLKNNHKQAITAFAISVDDTLISEDFAYSDIDNGIEPGKLFRKSYPISSPAGSPATLYFLAVLLADGDSDGNSEVARKIKHERLGERLQILRTLKILEKEKDEPKDLQATKNEIVTALDTNETETLTALNELQPAADLNNKLSNELRTGLQVGREKMLRRFEVLEKLPREHRQQAFTELKERATKLLSKL